MANELINSKTVARHLKVLYIIDEDVDGTLYDAIVADEVTLPEASFVQLITSAGVATTKLVGSAAVWSEAGSIGSSAASQEAVADLDAIATIDAVDPATTMALVNICKAKINEVIAALQS